MIPPIVSREWLREHLHDVVICDVRSTMNDPDPQAAFEGGHLPGARLVNLDTDLADPPGHVAGRHPLPMPDRFAEVLGASGVGDDTTVVAYDSGNGGFAARLVWMLRILGGDAALLDGGLDRWDGEVEDGPTSAESVTRTPVEWPLAALATADEVAEHVRAGGVVVDSREAARYRGEVEPIDPVAGHVPGAINLPFAENVQDGRFLGQDELASRFAELGSGPETIVYCGSGVTACHNALAVERAGLGRPRVYVGSWSGWSSDPERPVATGAD